MEHRKRGDQYLRLRNWLNGIFMLGAVAGIIVYLSIDKQIGTIIILIAMAFKIVEASMRLIKR